MQVTTVRLEEDLHQELSDVVHEKRKTDKSWSLNREIVLRLETYTVAADLVGKARNYGG